MGRLRCVICHEPMNETLSLFNYFSRVPIVCHKCESDFKLSNVRRCPHCKKVLQDDEMECTDCQFISNYFTPVDRIDCLFDYSDAKDLITRYKYHRDIYLAHAFAHFYRRSKLLQGYDMIIAMPSSPEKIESRGFDHIGEVGALLGVTSGPLKMIARVQQAKLTKKERISEDNPFYIDGEVPKRVLLLDDIYTTGLTVHRAAEVLRVKGAHYIGVLTFARA